MPERRNQRSKPIVNTIGPTQKEPKKVTIYYKEGNSTMLLARKVPYERAIQIESRLRRAFEQCGSKMEGKFLCTQ